MKKLMALTVVVAIFMPFLASKAIGAGWNKAWGPVGSVVETGDHRIYATKLPEGDIYLYTGKPGMKWEMIGGPGKKFVTVGKNLYGLSPDGSGVWRYTGTPMKWDKIGGPASEIYGGGSGLFATNPQTGDIYVYDLVSGGIVKKGWMKIGGPGKMFAVGGVIGELAASKYYLYGLSPDGKKVFQFNFNTMKWAKIGGAASSIYAGSDKVYATNPTTGDIWGYNLVTKQWTKVGGPGKMFAVDDGTGALYGLSPDGGAVWRYTGTPIKWEKIGGPAGSIYTGPFGRLYATSPQTHDLWSYQQ
jgi:hypothetical protein